MLLVELDIARQHCKADSDDDAVLQVYLGAAEQHARTFLNRAVHETQSALDAALEMGSAGPAPIVVNDAIRSAILLLCGHWYAHREDVVTGTIAPKVPMGAHELLLPYRRFAGAEG